MTRASRRARRFAGRVRRITDPPSIRASWWAAGELRRLRRRLAVDGLEAVVGPPPNLPPTAITGVRAVTRLVRATCLERSLLLQSWFVGQGARYDVLVGVNRSADGVEAHAWLNDYETPHETFSVLARRAAR